MTCHAFSSLVAFEPIDDLVADESELLHLDLHIVIILVVVWVDNSRDVLDVPPGELSLVAKRRLVCRNRFTDIFRDEPVVEPSDKLQLHVTRVTIELGFGLFNDWFGFGSGSFFFCIHLVLSELVDLPLDFEVLLLGDEEPLLNQLFSLLRIV